MYWPDVGISVEASFVVIVDIVPLKEEVIKDDSLVDGADVVLDVNVLEISVDTGGLVAIFELLSMKVWPYMYLSTDQNS